MAYPRFRRSRAHKTVRRTSGHISFTSATWVNLDTGLDIVLDAQVGDVIEAHPNGMWQSQAVSSYMDICTVVAGSPVNSFATASAPSGTNEGVPGWFGNTGAFQPISGGAAYTLQAGDIEYGQVTLRIRVRSASATSKTVNAVADSAFMWYAKNLGPADPN